MVLDGVVDTKNMNIDCMITFGAFPTSDPVACLLWLLPPSEEDRVSA